MMPRRFVLQRLKCSQQDDLDDVQTTCPNDRAGDGAELRQSANGARQIAAADDDDKCFRVDHC